MDTDFEILRYTQDKHPDSHLHEHYEIFISLSNEGKFFVREEGYPLQFGMTFILNPFEIHRCFCKGSQPYDRYVLHFSENYLKMLSTKSTDMEVLFSSAPVIHRVEGRTLAKMMDQLSTLSAPPGDEFGDDVERNIRLSEFLLLIARIINSEKISNVPMTKSEDRISEILRYIHSNYNQDISLECLSKQFFISKSRLSQVFKDTTGFSVGDYILTYRIKTACTLLKSGMRVQDVGEITGFHTSANFIRAFKKRTGYSPGKFSKNPEKEDN